MMQIYYINLARRTDRRAFMEEQFARLGLTATRIEAVTPADLTDAQRDRPIDPSTGTTLPEAALCCGLSHLRAHLVMLAASSPWALILEDDSVLSASLPPFLDRFEAHAPETLIVRIEAAEDANLTLWRSNIVVAGVRLHRYTGYSIGSAGYLVSRDAARLVASAPETSNRDIDIAMFSDVARLSRQLKPLQCNPGLCVQAQGVFHSEPYARSDLISSRRPDQLSPWGRLAKVFDRDVALASRKAWHRFARGATRTRVPFKAD